MSSNSKKESRRPPTILLGVTSSIAAYKACELTRQLVQRDWDVHVIMTQNATELIAPLTFQTLSKNTVTVDLFAQTGKWRPEHISLAEMADLLVIVPATANMIAKMAHGLADDALSTTALAFKGPVIIAPSMNSAMLENAATQANISTLKQRGIRIVEPESGELACGESGPGRLAPVGKILHLIDSCVNESRA